MINKYIKIISVMIGIMTIILIPIMQRVNHADYSYGDRRLIGLGVVSIFLGIIFGFDSLCKKRTDKSNLKRVNLIDAIIMVLIGAFILCMFLYSDSTFAKGLQEIGDWCFDYIISPLIVISCIAVLFIMFAPQSITGRMFRKNTQDCSETVEEIAVDEEISDIENIVKPKQDENDRRKEYDDGKVN